MFYFLLLFYFWAGYFSGMIYSKVNKNPIFSIFLLTFVFWPVYLIYVFLKMLKF